MDRQLEFTMNGLYGDDANRPLGFLGGNTNHGIELNSVAPVDIYTDEFEEMWGSTTDMPAPNFR